MSSSLPAQADSHSACQRLASHPITFSRLTRDAARPCDTTRKHPGHASMPQIHEQDVANVDWSQFSGPVRLLAAGPPCQPFSNGGKHLAQRDQRNQFPSTLRAVRELRPAVVLLENVPGLLRRTFRPYLDYIVRQLACPSVAHRAHESWQEHNARLLDHRRRSGSDEPEYSVHRWTMNVADYGIAQSRLRVFIVAIRRGLPSVTKPATNEQPPRPSRLPTKRRLLAKSCAAPPDQAPVAQTCTEPRRPWRRPPRTLGDSKGRHPRPP